MVQRRGTSAGRAWRWDTRLRLRGAGTRGPGCAALGAEAGPGGLLPAPLQPPASSATFLPTRSGGRLRSHFFPRMFSAGPGTPGLCRPSSSHTEGRARPGGARAGAGRPGSFSADAEPRLLRGPAWEAGAQLWGLREHSPGGDRAPRGQEPLRPSSMTQRHAPPPSESDNAHFPPKRPLLGMVQKKVPCGQITSPPIGQTFQRPRPHGDELTAPPRPPLSRPCGVLSTLIFQKHACFHGAKTT